MAFTNNFDHYFSRCHSFICPCILGSSISTEWAPSRINDTVVDTIVLAVDGDGNVVEEKVGVMIEF